MSSNHQDNAIHARIPYHLINEFNKRLDEGHVYRLHRFTVLPYTSLYRPLRKECFVQFTRDTSISPSLMQPSLFKRYVFDFTPFSVLPSRVNEDTYLTDVIGVLREWGCLETEVQTSKSCNAELRKITLANEASMDVNVTLWGQLARKYNDEEMRRYAANTVVVVLTCCKVRTFKGFLSLVSTSSSQLHVNLPLPDCVVFNAMLPIPVLFKSHVQANEDFTVNSVADVYKYLQGGVAEGTMYHIAATIIDVDLFDDWKFVRCSTCHKKARFIEDAYYCSKCKKNVSTPRQAYKLVVRLVDTYDEITCVMFDEVAVILLGITAEELIDRSIAEAGDDPFWVHNFLLDSLCARSVIFRIKIGAFNLAPHCSQRFTVSKYICDNMKLGGQNTISPSVASNSLPLSDSYEDSEEDNNEFLARITPDEWELGDEALWGPRIPSGVVITTPLFADADNIHEKKRDCCIDEGVTDDGTDRTVDAVSGCTTLSSLASDTEQAQESEMSIRDELDEEATVITATTVERAADVHHDQQRPRRSRRKTQRFTA